MKKVNFKKMIAGLVFISSSSAFAGVSQNESVDSLKKDICTAYLQLYKPNLATGEQIHTLSRIEKILTGKLKDNGFKMVNSAEQANLIVSSSIPVHDYNSLAEIHLNERSTDLAKTLRGSDGYGIFSGPSDLAAIKDAAKNLPVCQ
jgi:hypothetical protein